MTTYYAYSGTSDTKINENLATYLGANVVEVKLPDFMSGIKIVSVDLTSYKVESVKNNPILLLSQKFVADLGNYIETGETGVERLNNLISRLKIIDHTYRFEVLSQYINETNS